MEYQAAVGVVAYDRSVEWAGRCPQSELQGIAFDVGLARGIVGGHYEALHLHHQRRHLRTLVAHLDVQVGAGAALEARGHYLRAGIHLRHLHAAARDQLAGLHAHVGVDQTGAPQVQPIGARENRRDPVERGEAPAPLHVARRARNQTGEITQRYAPALEAQVGIEPQRIGHGAGHLGLHLQVLVDVEAHVHFTRQRPAIRTDAEQRRGPLATAAGGQLAAYPAHIEVGLAGAGGDAEHWPALVVALQRHARGLAEQAQADHALVEFLQALGLRAGVGVHGKVAIEAAFAQPFVAIDTDACLAVVRPRGQDAHRPAAQALVEAKLRAAAAFEFQVTELTAAGAIAMDAVEAQQPARTAGHGWLRQHRRAVVATGAAGNFVGLDPRHVHFATEQREQFYPPARAFGVDVPAHVHDVAAQARTANIDKPGPPADRAVPVQSESFGLAVDRPGRQAGVEENIGGQQVQQV